MKRQWREGGKEMREENIYDEEEERAMGKGGGMGQY